ncbi:MAG: ATP-dependent Clp protease proteolytic subunit [Pseudanabaenaceae cyanobacterium SKYGB_i_bin29]|nr:ATP-dependent Clp protease proteolytic subunit [Pseudanabaenaceae cyanobacterium SKYG29]MDW8422044.1 ATP-dependent Clp protease proteolytic subunit [Pseudanabaenaceae cyanobacterium SKYGB_i_bin29]
MPIGIPKVPYRYPGDSFTQWISIYERLSLERIIFISGEVTDGLANSVIARLLYMDSEDKDKDIYIYINSPGGSVSAGLAIFDTMQHIKADVCTICIGLAASMGSFLLMAGTKGKRFALPHSRIMIHQPSGGIRGQASDIAIEAKEILRLRRRLNEEYAKRTGQPLEKIERDMNRDYYMSAYEAKEYGLIDRVIEGPA